MIARRLFCSNAKQSFKRKSSLNDVFRTLPRVPTTQFLESRELTRDILFSGYRPIMYPVKQNPLFAERNRNGEIRPSTGGTNSKRRSNEDNTDNHSTLSGSRGCGGIRTGGVNGTWRYAPKLPNELMPYNLWSTTSMGMEYFPEWLNIPREMARKLKPFDRALKKT